MNEDHQDAQIAIVKSAVGLSAQEASMFAIDELGVWGGLGLLELVWGLEFGA